MGKVPPSGKRGGIKHPPPKWLGVSFYIAPTIATGTLNTEQEM